MNVPIKRGRGRPSSRETMLDAASTIVIEEGAHRLTLDAVAKRSGTSKGGVMYNFPTKEALLEALVERIVAHNQAALQKATQALPEGPGRAFVAYVQNSLRVPDTDDQVSGALLAVLANHPKLVSRVAAFVRTRFEHITHDVPFERSAIVYLATEGLWLLELLNASPFDKKQRARVASALLGMARAQDT